MKEAAVSRQLFSPDDLQQSDSSEILNYFYRAAVINSLSVVLWRSPVDKQKYALVNFSGKINPLKIDFNNNQAGFAFSPFRNDNGTSTLFLDSHLLLNSSAKVFTEERVPEYRSQEINNRYSFSKSFNNLVNGAKTANVKNWFSASDDKAPDVYNKKDFCKLTADSISHIKSSNVKKIVVSRTIEMDLPVNFDPVKTFEDLSDKYPDAFVSLIAIPGIGTWLGATPETLISLRENSLTTMALAGTKAITSDVPINEINWNHKEIEEQELVARFIRSCLNELGCESFEESSPKTARAGNVVHLQSLFKITMAEAGLKKFATRFLALLHPTPAVCGLPKNEALSFILEHEMHNREFYSGFLGPVNINYSSSLYVNLRCMKLMEKHALLYAGCGITGESEPEKEWKETELKANTLLSVIRK